MIGLWILNTNNGLVKDQVPENVASEVYDEIVKDNIQILNGLAEDVGSVSSALIKVMQSFPSASFGSHGDASILHMQMYPP